MIRKRKLTAAPVDNPNWIVVRLREYFEHNKLESEEAWDLISGPMRMWCLENVDLNSWGREGVTKYSYRYLFEDPLDATAFKLKFGIF